MKLERPRNFIARKKVLSFVVFWLIGLAAISVRICYDIKIYFCGTTLFYHNVSKNGYEYLLHLPKGYTDFDEPKPLIIYLHGAGETGITLSELKQRDIINCTKTPSVEDFPFIVVSPVTPKHGWEPKRIVILLDELLSDKEKRWKIDEKRIYLTGFSMGGFGTFKVACEYPDRFAAIVPVAGGGEPEKAERLRDLPTWAFHGDADDVVPYECSSKMIEAMLDIKCKEAKLTTLKGAGHGIMYDVYSNPETYRWMLNHRRQSNEK